MRWCWFGIFTHFFQLGNKLVKEWSRLFGVEKASIKKVLPFDPKFVLVAIAKFKSKPLVKTTC